MYSNARLVVLITSTDLKYIMAVNCLVTSYKCARIAMTETGMGGHLNTTSFY